MSSTAIPKKLFEKVEPVHSNDHDVDPENIVYLSNMDSDSESSEKQSFESCHGASYQEIVPIDGEAPNIAIDITEEPFYPSIKNESEVIIDESMEDEDDPYDFFTQGNQMSTGSPGEPELIKYNEEESEKYINVTDATFDMSITPLNPPPGMAEPPENDENEQSSDEEQFQIIQDSEEIIKTEQPTQEQENDDTEEPAPDTSLLDHQYSQQEPSHNEFCYDLVQNMLKETGSESDRLAQLKILSNYNKYFDPFIDGDDNSQLSLFLKSMEKTLGPLTSIEQLKKLEPVTEDKAGPSKAAEAKPLFTEVPMTQESEPQTEKIEDSETTQEYLLAETPSLEVKSDEIKPEVDVKLKEETEKEDEEAILPESESAVQLKIDLTKVSDCGKMLTDEATELMNLPMTTEEELKGANQMLVELIGKFKSAFRVIAAEVQSKNGHESDGIKQNSKKKTKHRRASSDFWNTDSEDDQIVNLNRKFQSQGPQPLAVVSSTKADSDDASDVSNEESKPVPSSKSSSSESETKGSRDNDKDIDKLLDFSTLICAKPASSKKTSKVKKLKKKKHKRITDNLSDLGSSSDDNSPQSSSSSTDDDRETSDEEKQMLMRQNADIKNDLLANSDESSFGGELTDFGVSSDEDSESEHEIEKKEKIKEKEKIKVKRMSIEATELSEEVEKEKETENVKEEKIKSSPTATKERAIKSSSDEEMQSDTERPAKKRIKRDSLEREIFSKGFLDLNGKSNQKPAGTSTSSSPSTSKPKPNRTSNSSQEQFEIIHETVDLSMFETKKVREDIDLQKAFERRANATEGARTSPQVQQSNPPKPAVVINDDDCIFLSSDSDSEVSAPTNGSTPKRKKMLTEEELQEETKKAQKEETQRIDRLKKKNEKLTQMLTERHSQESDDGFEEVVLDFDSKREVTITVHRELARKLKQHQREGVKFMYDTCFGSIGDNVKTESGCILAHCMGLGKTLQLITLVHTLICHQVELKTKKVLVICPKSTIMNWYSEFEKWLKGIDSKQLKLFYLPDTVAQQKNVFEERANLLNTWFMSDRPGVFLINYDGFRNLVNYSGSKRAKIQTSEETVKKIQNIISKCLLDPGPDLVVCDEGHLIKNETGATNKAITKISTRRRIILTGTPVQNNLNEYYAMVNWIKPALLGTVKEFNNLYANPIKDGQNIDSSLQAIKRMKQRSMILNKKLSNIVQRKEAGVLKEFLPNKFEYCIFIPLTQDQEKLYEEYLNRNPMINGHKLLEDYTALRKIWTHPKVLQTAYERAKNGELKKLSESRKRLKNEVEAGENDEPDDLHDRVEGSTGVGSDWFRQYVKDNDLESLYTSNKLFVLFEILRQCQQRGEKVLVFSGFVAVLNTVEDFMKKINNCQMLPSTQDLGYQRFATSWIEGKDYYRLDGSTKREHRHEMIKNFNDTSNHRLRCFLISSKAGGMGINLIGANRCIILDTSWNPSSDQQNIFRIYRLGQMKTCYVYRLIALGTMEEKVYSRSVTKQAMSGRVVDKLQIDRHYRMDELSELYTLEKFDFKKRPAPIFPADDILKYLLLNEPRRAYKYHDHDSLLENKPEQGLSDEEIKEAWAIYEAESKGPIGRAALGNGNINMPSNDMLRSDMLNYSLYGGTSSSIDATSSLFKQLYPPSYYANDYLTSLMLSDPAISAAFRTSATSSMLAASSSSKALRNQLSSVSAYPSMPLYGLMGSSSSSSKPPNASLSHGHKLQRTSSSKKPASSSMDSLVGLAHSRYNGNLARPNEDVISLAKNSSANLSILPDADVTNLRNSLSISKRKSLSIDKSSSARTSEIYKPSSSLVKHAQARQSKVAAPTPLRKTPVMETPVFSSQGMISSTITKSPVTQAPRMTQAPPSFSTPPSVQRSSSSTNLKPQQSNIVRQLPPKALSQSPVPKRVATVSQPKLTANSPKTVLTQSSQEKASLSSPISVQRPPNPQQSTFVYSPATSTNRRVILPTSNKQPITTPATLQQNISITPVLSSRPQLSMATLPSSLRVQAIPNTKASMSTIATPIVSRKNVTYAQPPPKKAISKVAFSPVTASKNAVGKTVMVNKSNVLQKQVMSKTNQNFIPQAAPRPVSAAGSTTDPKSSVKIVMNPIRTQTISIGEVKSLANLPQSSQQTQFGNSNSTSFTKVNSLPKPEIRQLTVSKPVQPRAAQASTSRTVVPQLPANMSNVRFISQKRQAEPVSSQTIKRQKVGPSPFKIVPREEREKAALNTPSLIEEIVEIE